MVEKQYLCRDQAKFEYLRDNCQRKAWKGVALRVMRGNPKYWRSYYTDAAHETFDLQYSLSDRIRYYWSVPEVQQACGRLLHSLAETELPLTLLSQYLPGQYAAIREGRLANDVRAILLEGVAQVLRQYAQACRPRN